MYYCQIELRHLGKFVLRFECWQRVSYECAKVQIISPSKVCTCSLRKMASGFLYTVICNAPFAIICVVYIKKVEDCITAIERQRLLITSWKHITHSRHAEKCMNSTGRYDEARHWLQSQKHCLKQEAREQRAMSHSEMKWAAETKIK